MNPTPVTNALPGEQLLAISPAFERQVGSWRRRLHLFSGRSLADTALSAEQRWREGRLAMLGRCLAPGILQGLEVRLELDGELPDRRLTVTSGAGLTVTGEDVTLLAPLEITLGELPVVLTAEGGEQVLAPGMEPTLAELVAGDAAGPVPPVAFLLLEPVVGARIGELDPEDPCERDVESEAFEDSQWVDGARLVLYAWPEDLLPLPPADSRARNRVASTLFDLEARRPAGQVLPWEARGLPLALLHLRAATAPEVLDRFAAARFGGSRLASALPGGSPRGDLWRVRLEQFSDHLQLLAFQGQPAERWVGSFEHLPPVGLLPKDALLPDQVLQRFFPEPFRVEAVPVPLPQLDRIVRDSGGLAPFDTARRELVRVAVPVPPELWEPALLVTEVVDPIFATTISELQSTVADLQSRHGNVAQKEVALDTSLEGPLGTSSTNFEDDPEDSYGTVIIGDNTRVAVDVVLLREKLDLMLGVRLETAAMDEFGLRRFIKLLESRVERANDLIDLGFLRVQTNIYKTRQLILGTEAASRLATSPALAAIARGESALSTREDLHNFLVRLKETPTTPPEEPPDGGGPPGPPAGGPVFPPDLGGDPALPQFNFPVLTKVPRTFSQATILQPGSFFESAKSAPSKGPTLESLTLESTASSATSARVASSSASLVGGAGSSLASGFQLSSSGVLGGIFSTPPVYTPPTQQEVTQQSPIVGSALNFRTTAVAKRLEDPPAAETKHAVVAGKAETLSSFLGDPELANMLEGLVVPGFLRRDTNGVLVLDSRGNFIEETRTFDQIREQGLLDEVLARKHDPDPVDGDEAAFFSRSVRALDHGVALLRLIEGRIQTYRRAIDLCRKAQEAIEGNLKQAGLRLQFLQQRLAEARHDLRVAQSLLQEETRRVATVNERRRRVLAEHVPFLLFYRPRLADLLGPAPAVPLLAPQELDPTPACLRRGLEPPPELRQMIDLLRDAPVRWLPALEKELDRLDRLPIFQVTLYQARQRALLRLREDAVDLRQALTGAARGPLSGALYSVLAAQRQTLLHVAGRTAELNLAQFQYASWLDLRKQAVEVVTLGDLLDSPHGRADVSRRALLLLENVTAVAACLYAGFAELLPALRLEWAQSLSQFDTPLDLRNLSRLAGWEEVPFEERTELQALVHWLYSQVNAQVPDAVAWISDLVRVAILLASHAPVAEIIAGDVIDDVTVTLGGRVRIQVDVSRVRVGLPVLLYSPAEEEPTVRAVVEDLTGDRAVVRVVQTYSSETIRLGAGAHAQFLAGAQDSLWAQR